MFLLSQSTHRMLMQFDSTIGHQYVPNIYARIPHERGGYFVRTNSQGFRSDWEFSSEDGDKPRVIILGDSVTAGDGCNNNERFSDLIAKLLNVETFNFALSGSGTDQQLLIFEKYAQKVKADLILICVPAENIERILLAERPSVDRVSGKLVMVPKPYFKLSNGELVHHLNPVPKERFPAEFNLLNKKKLRDNPSFADHLLHYYLYSDKFEPIRKISRKHLGWLRTKLLQGIRYNPYPQYKDPNGPEFSLLRAIIRRLADGAGNTPLAIAPLPRDWMLVRGLDYPFQNTMETLSDLGSSIHVLNCIDSALSQSSSIRRKMVFKHDMHYSPAGHRFIAEALAPQIKTILPQYKKSSRSEKLSVPNRLNNRISSESNFILGISCMYHNSAAAIIKNGNIIAAAEEERFTRIKNDRRFPSNAINYCLEEAGVNPKDLTSIVYYDNAYKTFERILHSIAAVKEDGHGPWMRILPTWLKYKLHLPKLIRETLHYDGRIFQQSHHRSHAASAFFPSPFAKAAILTVDGVGEWATASIGIGDGSDIRLLKEMRFPHSIGLLYSAFTQFIGFKVNSGEYKMMGLAPYGKPIYKDAILEHLMSLNDDGSIELNIQAFDFLKKPTMTGVRFSEIFGGPARQPESRITQREMDIARSIQEITEESLLRMAQYTFELTKEKNLCLSGGVALNCVANGRILREGPFDDIWIQPAAGDSGSALGAALDIYYNHYKNKRIYSEDNRSVQKGSYWGPKFSSDEVKGFLDTHGYPYKYYNDENERSSLIAKYIAEGKVVGHFSGRMEFGPRALGSRSILGDSRNPETQTTLNLKIKYRESFRPFAPAVLAERVGDYFELNCESPYMLLVAPVSKDRRLPLSDISKNEDMLKTVRQPRSDIPAITHVDYSARVQSVSPADHPPFYNIIKAFEKETGCGVIVNTSFNVRGEPIVCTPYDGYRCFMRTEMDVLVLENFILLKENQPLWPEQKGHYDEYAKESEQLYPDEFLSNLENIFNQDFEPIASELVKLGQIEVKLNPEIKSSTWVEVGAEDSAPEVFKLDDTFLQNEMSPNEIAKAITLYWRNGDATESLRPILIKLLKLSNEYLTISADLNEDVDDSIYVMF